MPLPLRRWLLLFFVVLLPLQFSWSVASAYCRHEGDTPQSQHLGHHAHEHVGEAPGAGSANKAMAGHDLDCGSCHQAAHSPLLAPEPPAFAPAGLRNATPALKGPPLRSAPSQVPDRPQWPGRA